ncbi:MAG: ABC transporter permease subunit, partial [Arthrobacter sp.]
MSSAATTAAQSTTSAQSAAGAAPEAVAGWPAAGSATSEAVATEAAPPGRAVSASGGVPPEGGSTRVATDYSAYRVVAAKHPWRWVGTAFVALGVLAVAWSLATNPRWEWAVVAQWFTAQSVISGLLETLKLTAISGILGFVLGFILALMRLSASPLLVSVSWTFSWIFRSTPLLVQLLLWYNLGYLYEKISLGIPFTDVRFFEAQTTTLISQFAAAVLGLTL